MGQTKTHLVAVQYGENDTVLNVIKVFNIDDNKYRELLNKRFLWEKKIGKSYYNTRKTNQRFNWWD